MPQGRIAKTLARTAVVSWREQPTQYDIEALRANIERVGLVIRVRWAIVAALAIFSVVAASVYALEVPFGELARNMTIPAIALLFVLMYNGFYQITYRKVGNIAFLNQAQLLFDILVTTVLVYYSGGVYSWFANMYLLFILEGAFILPRRSHVWLLVLASAAMYGFVLGAEYWGWIPHVDMPFVENGLYLNQTYVLVRYLWKLTLYGGAGTVGMLMMKRIHEREQELAECSFVDETTGLFNRPYFYRTFASELERARRGNRALALMLVDIYQFGEFNRTFGMDVGDEMLAAVAARIREVAHGETAAAGCDVNVACRLGGEEIALIIPEVRGYEPEPIDHRERALALAERLRAEVESTRVRGLGVVVSVGVSIMPADGDTAEALLEAADTALSRAADQGGNVVVASWQLDAALQGPRS
ncbi:MAG: GGDEF domain-containing protein [Anaerosomatales bacterium]|nr:GGDEF domain-containing protein [Anaerosomatales bacterium]